jgi:hypothetical protein
MNKQNVAEWHTLSKLQATDEVLTKRCGAFDIIIAKNEIKFWLDIVRLYLGIKVNNENVTFFISTLQTADDSIPRMKIEKLVKSLAGIAILCKIEAADTKVEEPKKEGQETDAAKTAEVNHKETVLVFCSALRNAIFFGQYKADKTPVFEKINLFLNEFGHEDRINNVDEHEEEIESALERISEEEESITDEENITILKATDSLIKAVKLQGEEINVLWWIFGGYSELAKEYFNTISIQKMCVIAAKELNDLSRFTTEFYAAQPILRKIITLSKDADKSKTLTVKECVDSITQEFKNTLLNEKVSSTIDELTPCLFAIKNSGNKGWEKSLSFDITKKLDPSAISMQFYREILFLDSI